MIGLILPVTRPGTLRGCHQPMKVVSESVKFCHGENEGYATHCIEPMLNEFKNFDLYNNIK